MWIIKMTSLQALGIVLNISLFIFYRLKNKEFILESWVAAIIESAETISLVTTKKGNLANNEQLFSPSVTVQIAFQDWS